MDLISIIVPIYNCEKYLKKCISSLINQTYTNIEIILINDGSKDKSREICEKFAKTDNRIKVINIKNGGVSNARNIGIASARGKYLGFIDADDWIERDMYEKMYTNMIENNANFSICEKIREEENEINNNIYMIPDNIKVLKKGEAINKSFDNCDKCYGGYVFNKLFNRDFIIKEKIKFDTEISISEDSLFILEYMIKFQNLKTVYNTKPYYHYVERKNSALREKFNKKKITVIDAYKKMIDILEEQKEIVKLEDINVSNVKRLYIKSNNNIYSQMQKYNMRDKEIEKKIRNNSKKYLKEVILSKKIGVLYKFDTLFSTEFPCLYEKIRKQF